MKLRVFHRMTFPLINNAQFLMLNMCCLTECFIKLVKKQFRNAKKIARRCSVKKVFCKIQKKTTGKKVSGTNIFPGIFVKFLRTPSLTELLWLLLVTVRMNLNLVSKLCGYLVSIHSNF